MHHPPGRERTWEEELANETSSYYRTTDSPGASDCTYPVFARGAAPLWHPTWLVNPSEDMIQRPSACQMYRTFQEDIFLLLNLRTAPQNPESIKSTEGAEREALSFPPGPRRLPAYLSVRLPLSLPRQHRLQAPLTLW